MSTEQGNAIQKLLASLRRQAVLWGVVIGLLTASLAVQIVRLLDHPGVVVAVCDPHGKCVEVQR